MHSYSLVAALSAAVSLAAAIDPDYEQFLSRPGQISPKLQVQFNKNPKALADGYAFISPYGEGAGSITAYGPLIYDMNGTLVWDGIDLEHRRAMDTHVCTYKGQKGTHICFTDAVPSGEKKFSAPGPGHSAGHNRIFDNTYTQVGTDYTHVGDLNNPDAHEFNSPDLLGGNAFIQDVYQLQQANLTQYDGPEDGWVLKGCFQQIDIDSHDLQFQWCSYPQVQFYESYQYIEGNSAGNGSTPYAHGTEKKPWDYFHINSIDIDQDGNYYVSSRTTHTIFHIAGKNHKNPGSIIWRLGGFNSDFDQVGVPFNFTSQHHIRILEKTKHTTKFSLYDNHTPAPKGDKQGSNGKIIELNTKKMTAELLQISNNPDGKYDPTGGAMLILDNNNVFLGFGSTPSVAEYLPGVPSEPIWYAKFAKELKSYRSFKYKWHSNPALPPDVFAYQMDCKAGLKVYASWNGATEYTAFDVYVNSKKSNSGGTKVGRVQKAGYETLAKVSGTSFHQYVYVAALNKHGKVLRMSDPKEVFVPNDDLAPSCSKNHCPAGTDYSNKNNAASKC